MVLPLFQMKLRDELAENYNVYVSDNGVNALQMLKSSPKPDLILSDVMMDRMDGFEFYRVVSKDENYSAIPFIFITA